MELDRRTFLRHCGQLAVITAAGGIGLDVFSPLRQAARASSLATGAPLAVGTPILVLIDLQGGNDAVNMLINPADPYYYSAAQGHGSLAIAQSSMLPLTGTSLGLHPSLQWLSSRWRNMGDVAFVQGSGENVKHEFSHFAAMYYRNVADFGGSEGRGWLGRYNDQIAAGSPFASVSLNGMHPALIGAVTPVLTVNDVASFQFDVDWHWRPGLLGAWQSMGSGGSLGSTMLAAAEENIADSFATQSAVLATENSSISSAFSGNFGRQLAGAAMMIQAGFPSQTYVATLSGFDTHGGEAYTQADLLTQLDGALNSFFSVIGAGPRAHDVFVVATSEFGRQHTANASAGCDHGQAGINIVLGSGVAGGLYGQPPLTDPAHRLNDALVPTVDFRSVYATVLNRLSGNTNLTATVLKSNFQDLGIFNGTVPPPPPTSTTLPQATTSSTVRQTTTVPRTTTTLPHATTTLSHDTTTLPHATTTVRRTTTTVPRTTTTTRK